MESSAVSQLAVVPGAEITCVVGDARLRNAIHMCVLSSTPFILEGDSEDLRKFCYPCSAVLVCQTGPSVLRGEGEVLSLEVGVNGRAKLHFGRVRWEQVDRRQFPRINISIPFKMRSVFESGEETVISVVEGRTLDLSVGGSKVQSSHPVLVGSLVEFEAIVNDLDRIRALGVVVYSDTEGILGISFMDYLGATRFKLEELTNSKAA